MLLVMYPHNMLFDAIQEPIHVDELEEISFIVANALSVFLTSSNSSYIYRYSPNAPYQRLGTIAIGPDVNKGML